MTAKDYLGQARFLDTRIDSKIQQVSRLRDLATKCTSTLSDMPKNPSPNQSNMENIICKIVDLENEINSDIDRLVDLKREIVGVIKEVENTDFQTLLEKRYLSYLTWEQIAKDLGFGIDNIFKLHRLALKNVKIPKTLQ